MRNALKSILFLVCFWSLFAALGCGVSKTNTSAQNQQAVATDIAQTMAAAAGVLTAIANTPLPPGVAGTPTAEAIEGWAKFGAALAPALSSAAGATANPTSAQ